MKICILEDERAQAERLGQFLARYQREHPDFDYVLEVYDRGQALLEAYSGDAAVLFLDIQLPDMLGIEAARRIRETDENVVIVFVTNLAQYAIDGYSVHASDYVLKPLAYTQFSAKMERILRLTAHAKSGTVVQVRTKQSTRHISASEIAYIEVSGHDVQIHTAGGRPVKCWGSLGEYERQLENDHFVRCNSCYLVNLKYVQGVEGNNVVVDGARLAISRPRRRELLNRLAQYEGGSR